MLVKIFERINVSFVFCIHKCCINLSHKVTREEAVHWVFCLQQVSGGIHTIFVLMLQHTDTHLRIAFLYPCAFE